MSFTSLTQATESHQVFLKVTSIHALVFSLPRREYHNQIQILLEMPKIFEVLARCKKRHRK